MGKRKKTTMERGLNLAESVYTTAERNSATIGKYLKKHRRR